MELENANRLTLRQLRKFPDDTLYTKENIAAFVKLVNDSYNSFDEERRLNNHVVDLSSKELNTINEQLNEKNEFLDSFNHGMAHDIKNHMSNITGLVTMLKKYHTRNEKIVVNTIIEKLELSSNQLTVIVQGFLYLSRAESNIDNQFNIINGEEVINAVKAETLFLTMDRDCEINYKFEIDKLFFSFHVIKIIFVNLISNSIKFSKKGVQAKINVSLIQNPESVVLSVSDNGIGMDLKNPNNKIFQLFNRTGDTKMVKGTGVGLFIIKKIVERNDGKIEVNSQLLEGTTFKITIPLK